MHGGHSGVGVDCGAFCIFANAVVIMTAWAISAALLFKLNTHYPLRGGPSHNGIYCGGFYIAFNASYSYIGWSGGDALDCFILCSSWWCF